MNDSAIMFARAFQRVLDEAMEPVHAEAGLLRAAFTQGFDKLDSRIDTLDSRIDTLDSRRVERQFAEHFAQHRKELQEIVADHISRS